MCNKYNAIQDYGGILSLRQSGKKQPAQFKKLDLAAENKKQDDEKNAAAAAKVRDRKYMTLCIYS